MPIRTARFGPFALVLLAMGSAAAPAHADASPSGWFLDRSGERRRFELEYPALLSTRRAHPLRAAGEMVLLIGAGTLYYVSDPLANEKNYDDPSLLEKLDGSAWCFDNNLTTTNFILHPLAGASFYGFSRVNGLPVLPSFAYAVLSSLTWEFALEWREQASVNDAIVTPFAGIALGEFLFRLGDYVNSGPASSQRFGNVLAKYTLGLPQAIHDGIDGKRPISTLPPDSLGFSSGYAHEFSVTAGLGQLSNELGDSDKAASLGVGARLIAMPGYAQLGKFSTFFAEGNFTAARFRALLETDGLAEVDARASAVFFGYYGQSRGPTGGLGYMLGLESAMRYYDSWRLGQRDTFAGAELPGPSALVWARAGSLRVELDTAGHVDFMGLRPAAYPRFRADHGNRGVKSVLEKRGYAYYVCASGSTELTLEYGLLQTGAFGRVNRCRSIEGLDRFSRHVDGEVRSYDEVTELRAWTRFPRGAPVQFGGEYEERWRSGSMAELEAKRRDRWVSGVVSYVF